MRRVTSILFTVLALTVFSTTAYAQAPAADGYGGQGGTAVAVTEGQQNDSCSVPSGTARAARDCPVEAQGDPAPAGEEAAAQGSSPQRNDVAGRATQQAPSSGLPFTGFDLALIGAGGALLLMLGLAMRRLAQPRTVGH